MALRKLEKGFIAVLVLAFLTTHSITMMWRRLSGGKVAKGLRYDSPRTCMVFDDRELSVEFDKISETAWGDINGNRYVQQSYLLRNNGTMDICDFEVYVPLNQEMNIYSNYSLSLYKEESSRRFGYTGVFPSFVSRLSSGNRLSFGFVFVAEKPEERPYIGKVCVTNVKVCNKPSQEFSL